MANTFAADGETPNGLTKKNSNAMAAPAKSEMNLIRCLENGVNSGILSQDTFLLP